MKTTPLHTVITRITAETKKYHSELDRARYDIPS